NPPHYHSPDVIPQDPHRLRSEILAASSSSSSSSLLVAKNGGGGISPVVEDISIDEDQEIVPIVPENPYRQQSPEFPSKGTATTTTNNRKMAKPRSKLWPASASA